MSVFKIQWTIVPKAYGETKINCCPLCVAETVLYNTLMATVY